MVDYGLGNLQSVAKAFEDVAGKGEVCVTSNPADIKRASHIILPGVGNFKTGMENLRKLGLLEPLKEEVINKGKPFLGICLGMQLLAEVGEEYGQHEGLGWIPGRVRMLNSNGLALPHIGWQDIEIVRDSAIFSDGSGRKDYYFVHSFVFKCSDEYVTAYCTYGQRFPAAIQKENIVATQFHPEKSREAGLEILRNFLRGKKCLKSEWFLSSF